eukprot:TRINITY_DN56226_c0_g1_i1.p1 TRINITY_DN56226_c0_g1~~TRINITY_DN56226_c0_g1_i1.p1  ORF type:complete len:251 (+),score=55.87 TRINITY_DN56226_c0_g1_i1:101-853(+)
MIRRPPRSTLSSSSAASDVYKRQEYGGTTTISMATVAGAGLFDGCSFWPMVPDLQPGKYLVRDFTRGEPQPTLEESGFTHDVGRYNERRPSRSTTPALFGTSDPAMTRDIHVGVDVGGPVGTAVHAIAEGVIHSVGYNPEALDYGHVMVMEVLNCPCRLWALYGHLSQESIQGKAAGDVVSGGEVLGWFGPESENGGWPPHVHFQLSLVEPETHDLPGVVSTLQHPQAIRDYPDPRMVLGPLYGGDGLFE